MSVSGLFIAPIAGLQAYVRDGHTLIDGPDKG